MVEHPNQSCGQVKDKGVRWALLQTQIRRASEQRPTEAPLKSKFIYLETFPHYPNDYDQP